MSTADHSPISSSFAARPDGSACPDSPHLRAVLATHVALQLVDLCCLRPANDVERDGRMRVTAETTDFKIAVASIEGVAKRGCWLGGPLKPSIRKSTPRRRAGRPLCALLSHARPTFGSSCRREIRGTWWASPRIAQIDLSEKPLGLRLGKSSNVSAGLGLAGG